MGGSYRAAKMSGALEIGVAVPAHAIAFERLMATARNCDRRYSFVGFASSPAPINDFTPNTKES
jgi:hypothetical protein